MLDIDIIHTMLATSTGNEFQTFVDNLPVHPATDIPNLMEVIADRITPLFEAVRDFRCFGNQPFFSGAPRLNDRIFDQYNILLPYFEQWCEDERKQ